MTTDRLTELAERCEAASGPDRELDRDIRVAISGRPCAVMLAPFYTDSIDAAMMLVPEGFRSRIDTMEDGRGGAWIWWPGDIKPASDWAKLAATPALAICAAALRSTENTHDD